MHIVELYGGPNRGSHTMVVVDVRNAGTRPLPRLDAAGFHQWARDWWTWAPIGRSCLMP